MNRAKLEKTVVCEMVRKLHQAEGEWLVDIDGEELILSSEADAGHGVLSVNFPPEDEPEDENEPWDEEGVTKKYALKVTVELTEVP